MRRTKEEPRPVVEAKTRVIPVDLGCQDKSYPGLMNQEMFSKCDLCGHLHFPQNPYCEFCKMETLIKELQQVHAAGPN